jgi:hypothetical protein
MPIRAVQLQNQLYLQIALYPLQDLGFDNRTVLARGIGFSSELNTCELKSLSVEKISDRDF